MVTPVTGQRNPSGQLRSCQVQEEESLVQRAQSSDPEAFSQLYERYFNKIFRYIALKIGNSPEAEDMTQQVFLKSLQSISSYRWRDIPFSAWLFRIAHNLVVDHLRKKTRQPTASLENLPLAAEDDPQEMAMIRIDNERLRVATKQLTRSQQEVISLRFSGELPIAEVARIMGKKPGAIKALQHSAIIALRKLMSEECDV
jgi:RNA polymerase sigma-70 factor (ECF subfamily)